MLFSKNGYAGQKFPSVKGYAPTDASKISGQDIRDIEQADFYHQTICQSRAYKIQPAYYLVRYGLASEYALLKGFQEFLGLENWPNQFTCNHKNYIALPEIETNSGLHRLCQDKKSIYLVCPFFLTVRQLQQLIYALKQTGSQICLISLQAHYRLLQEFHAYVLENKASRALLNTSPHLSAARSMAIWQKIFLGLLPIVLGYFLMQSPDSFLQMAGCILAPLFLCLVLIRILALIPQMRLSSFQQNSGMHPIFQSSKSQEDKTDQFPVYTVLVPVYHEKECLPSLISALKDLQYPIDKLEIKVITEACDVNTRKHLYALNLPSHIEVLTVPEGNIRTKPRALNYAFHCSKGALITIYDAEDIPQSDQLLKAASRFAQLPDTTACLQAKLEIYNTDQNLLTQLFTLEYALLFSATLPTSMTCGFPAMLGGTSNHFRREALESVGAWDPHNVTEDADLGIRLYRAGYHCCMLDSVTLEQACYQPVSWFKQRTRWLKGWIQTWFVHMRKPGKLVCQLGLWQFAGFQILLAGQILAALSFGIFTLYMTLLFFSGTVFYLAPDASWEMLRYITLFNLPAAWFFTLLLGWIILPHMGKKFHFLFPVVLWAYWLLISLACLRAVLHFFLKPFKWEKTPHDMPYYSSVFKAGTQYKNGRSD